MGQKRAVRVIERSWVRFTKQRQADLELATAVLFQSAWRGRKERQDLDRRRRLLNRLDHEQATKIQMWFRKHHNSERVLHSRLRLMSHLQYGVLCLPLAVRRMDWRGRSGWQRLALSDYVLTLDPTALELVWSRRAKRSQLAVAPRPDHAKAEAAHRRLKISEEGAVQVTAGVKRWENQARSNSKGREGHDKRGSTRELGRTGRPSIALLRITDYTISPDYYNNDFTIKYAERVGEEGGDELALVAHSAAAKSVWNVVLADLMQQRQKELRIATAQRLTHAERQHMARVTHLVSSDSLRELHSERHAVMTQSPDVSLGSLPGIGGGSSGLARIVSQAQGSDAGG